MRLSAVALSLLAAACAKETAPEAANPEAAGGPAIAAPETAPAARPSLEAMWVAEGFSAPEGVALSPDGAYFISNVGGEETDGDGYISKLGADGKIITERFIDGLDGPKGMAVHDGFLYATDIEVVRLFDAATGAAGAIVVIPEAKFLNDATVWNGEVYVSDSGTARIWRLSPEGPVVWREGGELSGVNGLLGDGDRMLVSTMTSGGLFEARADGGWREIAAGMENADGIGIVSDGAGGGFLVSSWPGEIHHVAPDGSTATLIDTKEAGVLQNDLTIYGDVAIVPNWRPGTVTAWRIDAAD